MPDRVDSPGHCKWVRTKFDCAVAGKVKIGEPRHIVCSGRIDPHHVKTRGAGGGDDKVVPMCRAHHTQLDSWGIGQETFQAIYGVDLPKMADALWRADSYHRAKWEQRMKDAAA